MPFDETLAERVRTALSDLDGHALVRRALHPTHHALDNQLRAQLKRRQLH